MGTMIASSYKVVPGANGTKVRAKVMNTPGIWQVLSQEWPLSASLTLESQEKTLTQYKLFQTAVFWFFCV